MPYEMFRILKVKISPLLRSVTHYLKENKLKSTLIIIIIITIIIIIIIMIIIIIKVIKIIKS